MITRLINQIQEKNAPIVVGLDPTMKLMPKTLVEKYFAEYGQTLEAVGEAMSVVIKHSLAHCLKSTVRLLRQWARLCLITTDRLWMPALI